MAAIELKVPDIGDFKDVEIIEVLVKAGDAIVVEQSLITVESDKASMEIPASIAGRIVEMRVKLGDKISEGSVLAMIEPALASAASAPAVAPPPAPAAPAAVPPAPATPSSASISPTPSPESAASAAPRRYGGRVDIVCETLVLGAGPGGYSAAFRAADLGLNTVMVERYANLGGVCLNVGCIPSKALLHVASVMDEVKGFAAHGISFGEPTVDLEKLRGWKTQVVGKLTGGLAAMAKARKVQVVQGLGKFLDGYHLEVVGDDGKSETWSFQKFLKPLNTLQIKMVSRFIKK